MDPRLHDELGRHLTALKRELWRLIIVVYGLASAAAWWLLW